MESSSTSIPINGSKYMESNKSNVYNVTKREFTSEDQEYVSGEKEYVELTGPSVRRLDSIPTEGADPGRQATEGSIRLATTAAETVSPDVAPVLAKTNHLVIKPAINDMLSLSKVAVTRPAGVNWVYSPVAKSNSGGQATEGPTRSATTATEAVSPDVAAMPAKTNHLVIKPAINDMLSLSKVAVPRPARINWMYSPIAKSKPVLKTVRVDNWGMFILAKLSIMFESKDNTDLILKFSNANASIRVHKVILNACTDFFKELEEQQPINSHHGYVMLPSALTPDSVAPIIKFMYTGRLEFQISKDVAWKLQETAKTLGMSVLSKLIEAQMNSSEDSKSVTERKVPVKQKKTSKSATEMTLSQIQNIKKIEQTMAAEVKKAKRFELISKEPRLPGRKLPIWKRKKGIEYPEETKMEIKKPEDVRNYLLNKESKIASNSASLNLLQTPENFIKKIAVSTSDGFKEEELDQIISGRDGSGEANREPSTNLFLSNSRVTYKRRSPLKKPTNLNEARQAVEFEMVRRTAKQIPSSLKRSAEEDLEGGSQKSKRVDAADIQEMSEELRLRNSMLGPDYDDADDYHDADTGYEDYDDPDEPSEVPCVDQTNEAEEVDTSSSIVSNDATLNELNKSILKPNVTVASVSETPIATRKSVRFSSATIVQPAKPSLEGLEVKKDTSTNSVKQEEVVESSLAQTPFANNREKTIPLQKALHTTPTRNPNNVIRIHGRKGRPRKTELDVDCSAIDMETESTPSSQQNYTVDGSDREIEDSTLLEAEPAVEAGLHNVQDSQSCLVKEESSKDKGGSSEKKLNAQSDMITEILKKYPNIIRDNKQIRLKVMNKQADGTSKISYITVKANKKDMVLSHKPEIKSKEEKKMIRSKGRGRGKRKLSQIVKDDDSTETEESYVQPVGFQDVQESISGDSPQQENRSLSKVTGLQQLSAVASGIAASLGLVAVHPDQPTIPPQQGYVQLAEFSGGPEEGQSPARDELENQMQIIHGEKTDPLSGMDHYQEHCPEQKSQSLKKVNVLEMEWDEDEDSEGEKMTAESMYRTQYVEQMVLDDSAQQGSQVILEDGTTGVILSDPQTAQYDAGMILGDQYVEGQIEGQQVIYEQVPIMEGTENQPVYLEQHVLTSTGELVPVVTHHGQVVVTSNALPPPAGSAVMTSVGGMTIVSEPMAHGGLEGGDMMMISVSQDGRNPLPLETPNSSVKSEVINITEFQTSTSTSKDSTQISDSSLQEKTVTVEVKEQLKM